MLSISKCTKSVSRSYLESIRLKRACSNMNECKQKKGWQCASPEDGLRFYRLCLFTQYYAFAAWVCATKPAFLCALNGL